MPGFSWVREVWDEAYYTNAIKHGIFFSFFFFFFLPLTKTCSTLVKICLNSSLQKLLAEWVQALGAVISGIDRVEKRKLWLVKYAYPPRWSQRSFHRKLCTHSLMVSGIGNSTFHRGDNCISHLWQSKGVAQLKWDLTRYCVTNQKNTKQNNNPLL